MKKFIRICIIVILAIAVVCTRVWVFENGQYFKKNEVAMYIYKYKKAPKNVKHAHHSYGGAITKKTTNKNLSECDIYKSKEDMKKGRGTLRLVYTNDGKEVFYTSDHYKSFSKVHRVLINWKSNLILLILLLYIGECIFEKDKE